MTQEVFIRLVLDVSVIGVAGVKDNALSRNCGNVLKYTKENECFRIVLSSEIRGEFNRLPNSPLINTWRQVINSQGRWHILKNAENEALRRKIRNIRPFQMDDNDKHAMLKDIRYVEAALLTDQRIISRDDEARACFKNAVEFIPEIIEIMWSNPVIPEDDTDNWLINCTPLEAHRQLGFIKDEAE